MQRQVISFSLIVAPISMAVALLAAGYSTEKSAWWSASVYLAVLGGITIMIYGINIHSVPAHSGRMWRSVELVAIQVVAGLFGAWLVFLGRGLKIDVLDWTGQLLATVGAVLFMTNLGLLFRQPGLPRPPKPPKAERTNQQRVDRLAIPFTIISGLMVIAGTALGLALTFWRPDSGRWDLVWAHMMLLGFFFPMASGTSYHMLSRWTGARWASIRTVQLHLYAYLVSFPLMVVALAWDIDWLFLIAGPLMALAGKGAAGGAGSWCHRRNDFLRRGIGGHGAVRDSGRRHVSEGQGDRVPTDHADRATRLSDPGWSRAVGRDGPVFCNSRYVPC
jgi:hypothetical protein